MKNVLLILFLFLGGGYLQAQEDNQEKEKSYFTQQSELIFSGVKLNIPGMSPTDKIRFTLFPNMELVNNYDFNKNFGFYAGLNFNNIGLIYEDTINHKFRSLSLGVPAALKFGNFENDLFVFAGAQYEFFFHYKEKHFYSSGKVKDSEWLSNKINQHMPSAFAGIVFNGFMLRFKYYFNDFFSQAYTSTVSGQQVHPYANTQSQIWYVSLAFRSKL